MFEDWAVKSQNLMSKGSLMNLPPTVLLFAGNKMPKLVKEPYFLDGNP